MDGSQEESFDVNPRRNLSAEVEPPWSTEGPDFINSESRDHLLTGSSHALGCTGFLAVSGVVRDPQTYLSGATTPGLRIHVTQVNLCREALVSSVDQ